MAPTGIMPQGHLREADAILHRVGETCSGAKGATGADMDGAAESDKLDDVASGDLAPDETLSLIRDLMREDAQRIGEKVYRSLLEVAWHLSRDRTPGREAPLWLDVFGRSAGMLRECGMPSLSCQVLALADMVERSLRFAELHPLEEVIARRHVPIVMNVMASHGKPMDRAALAQAAGLGEMSLSRMLAILEGHGLIRRSRRGRESQISLTAAGKEMAGGPCGIV